MIWFVVIAVIFVALFGINYYYTEVVLWGSQANNILRAKKGKWDVVTLGSTMCKYAFDFKDSGVDGFNFGYAAQFFYYTDITLRSYSKYFNKGCWVVITCPNLVFAEPGKGVYFSPEMMKMFSKESLGDEYNFRKYITDVKYPIFFHPTLLLNVFRYMLTSKPVSDFTITGNPLDAEGMKKNAEAIYGSWDRNFHIEQMASENRPDEMERKINHSRELLSGMIQYCLNNGFRPVLAVTPISKALDQYIYREKEKILFDNIRLANKQQVPVLNYLQDERFEDDSLYLNSFKLNATGRKRLTDILLNDLNFIDKQNDQS